MKKVGKKSVSLTPRETNDVLREIKSGSYSCHNIRGLRLDTVQTEQFVAAELLLLAEAAQCAKLESVSKRLSILSSALLLVATKRLSSRQ